MRDDKPGGAQQDGARSQAMAPLTPASRAKGGS